MTFYSDLKKENTLEENYKRKFDAKKIIQLTSPIWFKFNIRFEKYKNIFVTNIIKNLPIKNLGIKSTFCASNKTSFMLNLEFFYLMDYISE